MEYMTGMRMKKAEVLLNTMRSDEYSVTQIGEMCGFDDALYFSRVFKKNYGCSPSNYARNQGKTVDSGRTELDER